MLRTNSDSLYGRIIQRYFGSGLVCIIVLMMALFSDYDFSQKQWLIPLVAVVPLSVFWLGGFEMRRILAAPEQILGQLSRISVSGEPNKTQLAPVIEAEPAAAGWNHLLERIRSLGTPAELEQRLSRVINNGKRSQSDDVMNSIAEGIAVTDSYGYLKFCNRSLRALLAVPIEEESNSSLNSLSIFVLLQNISRDGLLPKELETKAAKRFRTEFQKSDNTSDGVYRISCVGLEDSDGSDEFVWTVRDITQMKLAESMRTEFVQTATHELRTPLANIKAYAETLELSEDIPVEQQKEFINIINAEATRLSRFVDELLNLSQMDAGSLTVSRHETHFERLVQECIEHARPQIDKKQQILETQIPAKLPSLSIDKDKIAACLVNLLGNASKYSPENAAIRIVIEESSTELTVRVEDSGFGISEEELPRIFNRFFRSDDHRVREESGTGLGLAYTEEVARLHGGRLSVTSELNEGSQFALHLPL